MKQPTKSMLQVDAIIQGILIIPMFLAYFVGVFDAGSGAVVVGLILQFFLGCYQLLSGFIRTIRHGSAIRGKYLMVAIGYVFALIVGGMVFAHLNSFVLGTIFVIIIPCIIALWYWRLTIMQASGSFTEAKEEKIKNLSTLAVEEDEDMVIDSILMRHKKRIKI